MLTLILISALIFCISSVSAVDFNKDIDETISSNEINHQGLIEIKDTNSMNCQSSHIAPDVSMNNSDINENAQSNSTINETVQNSEINKENKTDNNQNIVFFEGKTFSELQEAVKDLKKR